MTGTFDFDKVLPREDTWCVKYGRRQEIFGNGSALPLWIADMDFPAPPVVLEALSQRLSHGIMGYTLFPEELRNAFRDWVLRRHRWAVDPEWIGYVPAVVPAIGLSLEAFTYPGDRVAYLSPGYPPFRSSIVETGRVPEASPLILDDGLFRPDFEDLEERLSRSRAFLLCSPHNPTGRVWTPGELRTMAELCIRYDVMVISDEIHWDLVYPPGEHVPFPSVCPDRSILLTAPGKTFNLPGLPLGLAVVPDEGIRERLRRKVASLHLDDGNCLALVAAEAAYRGGEPWLEALLPYLRDNLREVRETLARDLPEVRLVEPQGTYIPLLDFRGLRLPHGTVRSRLIREAGVLLNDGLSFGPEGEGFFRLNVATPRSLLRKALAAMARALGQRS